MYNALIIALLSGGFAATVNILYNLYAKIWDRRIDLVIKKLNALTSVEYLMCNLRSEIPLDMNNYKYYYSIFDSINSIELYLNSIRLINLNRFYLSRSIIDKIEVFEALFQDILRTCYMNRGNEDKTIMDIGVDNFNEISRIKKELRGFIDEELRKLK